MEERRLWGVCRRMEEHRMDVAELETLGCWQLDSFGLEDVALQHELLVVLGSCKRWQVEHGTGGIA